MKQVAAIFATLAVLAGFQQAASGAQLDQEFYTTQRPQQGIFQDSGKGFWSSLVNVDRQNNRSKVDVHLPIIFDMTNDKDLAGSQKLDLSVLGGLVTVNRDREKQPNGTSSGPMVVTVFGIPVYSGYGGRRGVLQRINDAISERSRRSEPITEPPIQNRLEPMKAAPATIKQSLAPPKKMPLQQQQQQVVVAAAAAATTTPTTVAQTDKLVSTIKKTNENVLLSMADTFGKFTSFVTQASPINNVNGQPADKSHGFVAPSRFSPADLQPKLLVTKAGVVASASTSKLVDASAKTEKIL